MASIGISDDYAVVKLDNGDSFYYGYEETVGIGDDEEWAFVAVRDGKRTTIGGSELTKGLPPYRQLGEPLEYLVYGMARILETPE